MIILLLLFLGLCFGSFVNAFVWRLREQELLEEQIAEQQAKKRPNTKKIAELRKHIAERSILKGRSMCTDCHHELAAKDLVPLFSWLSLGGKCRYCRKAISWQYPAVEAATAALFVLSYLTWPLETTGVGLFQLILWLVFIVMFMALTVYDLRWYLLPDIIVFPLIALAAVQVAAVAIWTGNGRVAVDGAIGALVISGVFWVLFQVSNGSWIGGGDVKLAVVLGLLAGTPIKALLIMFFSSVIGTICSIPILAQGKKSLQMRVPFGPFLIAGTVVVVLYGQAIIDWYTSRLLHLN